MSCYVDHFNPKARSKNWRYPGASHLVCDTSAELDALAVKMGLRPEWKQSPGAPTEHFDLTRRMRAEAVRLGAKEVSIRDLAHMIIRKTGQRELAL